MLYCSIVILLFLILTTDDKIDLMLTNWLSLITTCCFGLPSVCVYFFCVWSVVGLFDVIPQSALTILQTFTGRRWLAGAKRAFEQFKRPHSLCLVSNESVKGLYWSVWDIWLVCMNLVATGSMWLSTDVSQTMYRHQTHLCCMKWMSGSVQHLCKVCIGLC